MNMYFLVLVNIMIFQLAMSVYWTSTARFVSSKVCGDVYMKKDGLFECLASIEVQ